LALPLARLEPYGMIIGLEAVNDETLLFVD
jgi:hypothetical protein